MPVPGYDIVVNGVPRHDGEGRDLSGIAAKQRNPNAVVTIKSTETREVRAVLSDGRLA
jgi:hypothetical protein